MTLREPKVLSPEEGNLTLPLTQERRAGRETNQVCFIGREEKLSLPLPGDLNFHWLYFMESHITRLLDEDGPPVLRGLEIHVSTV